MRPRAVVLGVALALALGPVPASGHDTTKQDADDSAGRLDVSQVLIQHPAPGAFDADFDDPQTIRFTISFYEPHQFGETDKDDGLSVILRSARQRFEWITSATLFRTSGDNLVGRVGRFRPATGFQVIGFANVFEPDPTTIVVEIMKRQLGWHGQERVRWSVGAGYFDEETCEIEEGVSDVAGDCNDVVPDFVAFEPVKWGKHDLQK